MSDFNETPTPEELSSVNKVLVKGSISCGRPWLSPEEDAFVNKVARLVTLYGECYEYLRTISYTPMEWEKFRFKELLFKPYALPTFAERDLTPTELQHIAEWIDAGKKPRVLYASTNALPELKTGE